MTVPAHIAIIPDGNRRWAAREGCTIAEGHEKGCRTLIEIVKAAKSLGVKHLTVYTFSTENWRRSPFEIDALMHLLVRFLDEQSPVMLENDVRLKTIGELSPLKADVREAIDRAKSVTKECSAIELILAINYGGRDELVRAAKTMLAQNLKPEELTIESLENYLDTAGLPDPELVIRTSGEKRMSNFLLWQTSYAEFYPTETYWPDFSPEELKTALDEFNRRMRRLGS